MMAAARTSETSVDIQLRTRQYITDDSELHTRRRENLKRSLFASELFPAYTEVTTYAVISPVFQITQLNHRPIKQYPLHCIILATERKMLTLCYSK
jgi:hypothetical protein